MEEKPNLRVRNSEGNGDPPPHHAPPRARFVANPTTGIVPLTVELDASTSSAAQNRVLGYEWQFGDGSTGEGNPISHTYSSVGSYTVVLTVDDGDFEASASRTITVNPVPLVPPSATLIASPSSGIAPFTVRFDASPSVAGSGAITSYAWDFGDGNTSSGSVLTHTYALAGTYMARVTVTNSVGLNNTASMIIAVAQNIPPSASFTATPHSGPVPLTVRFDASASSDPDDTIASYTWDFGDGASASGNVLTHTYTVPGLYSVMLTVSDVHGASSSKADSIQVVVNQPPVPAFTATPASGIEPLLVSFDASQSSDPDDAIATYSWNLGDGTSASGSIITQTYKAGTYNVVLTVTDSGGVSASMSKTITVAVRQQPVALIIAIPSTGTAPLSVVLDATSSNAPSGRVVNYAWDLGDGNRASGSVVTHTYAHPGTFTVKLTVTDDGGATNSTNSTITAN